MRRNSAAERVSLMDVYTATRKSIFAQALRVTNDYAGAEEVVQDVFLYAWLHSESYESSRSSLLTWLTVICKSKAIDYLRANISRYRNEISDPCEMDFESNAPSQEALFSTSQSNIALVNAYGALSSMQRQLLVLHYYSELSHHDISDFTQLPLGTVKTILRRTRLALLKDHRLRIYL